LAGSDRDELHVPTKTLSADSGVFKGKRREVGMGREKQYVYKCQMKQCKYSANRDGVLLLGESGDRGDGAG
jgi:hypothetical protein